MWRVQTVVAVATLAIAVGSAGAYELQFVGYSGPVHLDAQDNQGWSVDIDDDYSAVATHPWYWGTFEATNTDLSGGGGAGAGAYAIGESACGASSFSGYDGDSEWLEIQSQASTTATYTWTLLSEYGNTGVVTLTLESLGWEQAWTPGGSGSASISVTSDVDSYNAEPTIYIDPDYWYWNDSLSFDVLIGGTITVVCETQGAAQGGLTDSGAIGGGAAEASFILPVEVPDPSTIALLGVGSFLALRRRRAEG